MSSQQQEDKGTEGIMSDTCYPPHSAQELQDNKNAVASAAATPSAEGVSSPFKDPGIVGGPSYLSVPVRPPLITHGSASNVNSKLDVLMRGAAMMFDQETSESEDSEDDEEDEESDSVVSTPSTKNRPLPSSGLAHGIDTITSPGETPAEAGALPDVNRDLQAAKAAAQDDDWERAKEHAASAVAKEKKHRKAIIRKLIKRKETNEHHAPIRGLSMLDEDEHLSRMLNVQTIDSLEETGAESSFVLQQPPRGLGLEEKLSDKNIDETTTLLTKTEEEEANKGLKSDSIAAVERLDPETKLKALISEFGESGQQGGRYGPEKLLADAPAVLMRTVLIRGTLIVTNHRVAFVARIASTSGMATPSPSDGSAPPRGPDEAFPVIRSGAATLHRTGWHRKRTGWFELRPDMITHYPASDKLYQPIGSLRMADIDQVLPHDWNRSKCVSVRSTSKRVGTLEFKTEEAALEWHREVEAALWSYRNSAEKIRISVPLERILGIERSSYLHFACVATINVLDDDGSKDENEDGDVGDGSAVSHTGIVFGVTHRYLNLLDVLGSAIEEPHKWARSVGPEEVLKQTGSPVIEIEGPRTKEIDLAHTAKEDSGLGLAARFITQFSLRSKPEEIKLVKADLLRTIPAPGTIAIERDYLCFWRPRISTLPDTKLRIPLTDLQGMESSRAFRWHYYGLRLHIRGHPDLLFEFGDKKDRDMTLNTLAQDIKEREEAKKESQSKADGQDAKSPCESPDQKDETKCAIHLMEDQHDAVLTTIPPDAIGLMGKVINARPDNIRVAPMRIFCLTIGSRGDVQPYIALCKGLKEQGHSPVIVSHPEYKEWVNKHGIEFRGAGGDPAALMKLSVEHRLFSPAFFRESISKFREWLDELLRECYEQCQGAEVLIESPSTMAGIHVAEALEAKYFRAFTMPWTPTSAYPQAFSVPSYDLGASYNSMSYTLFDQVFWRATASQINRWRKHMLHLAPTDLGQLDQNHVPFMYNFSPAVVPHPLDWGNRVLITGYWNLTSEAEKWTPPDGLEAFMDKAKEEGKKLCYIGFGSIVVDDSESVTRNIFEAVKKADVRAIVCKGWSGRMSKKDPSTPVGDDVQPPSECFVMDSIPHDWLFPKIDVALHHGGAGTTGASLRAGLVTLIKPFFGDQFFWALQVKRLGAGARVHSLDVSHLASALTKAAANRIMVEKAAEVGERIRTEDGVAKAIQFIYQHLGSAKRVRHPYVKKEKPEKASHGKCTPSRPSSPTMEGPPSSAGVGRRASLFNRPKSPKLRPTSPTRVPTGGSISESSVPDTPVSDDEFSHPSRTGSQTVLDVFRAKSLRRVTSPRSPGATDTDSSSMTEVSAPSPGSASPPRRSSTAASSILSSASKALAALPVLPAPTLPTKIKEALHTRSASGVEDQPEPAANDEAHDASTKEKEKEAEADKKPKRTYKTAKAEDQRRAKLLEERLAKEKAQQEGTWSDAESAPEGATPNANDGGGQTVSV